jgi:hypothetical protein
LDGPNDIGVLTHITGPDGALVVEPDGSMGAVYDSLGTPPPGFHLGRTIRGVTMEPSATCLRFSSTSVTATRISRSIVVNADLVVEFIIEVRRMGASTGVVAFEFRRQDNSNYYRLAIVPTCLDLRKVVAGVDTELTHPTMNTEAPSAAVTHRVRLIASGTRIQAWLNGEQHINTTDATFSSGSSIAFSAQDCDIDIRRFSLRTAQNVTINGIGNGVPVTVRGAGGIPITTAVGPDPVISLDHAPAISVDVNGTNFRPAGGIWGGDVYQVSGMGRLPLG